ncbi:GNAT family N-acetyltransferase [Candidatus Woesearchaeota archaeon]|nr:GNAT family N-acetyltransferase [Candidatus Woesearchaeota archaeon]
MTTLETTVHQSMQTYLLSEAEKEERNQACEYVAQFIGHPDEGSEFGKKLRFLKYAFRIPRVGKQLVTLAMPMFEKRGYDALMLRCTRGVIGLTAFQVHNEHDLHVFSVKVNPAYQNNGLAFRMQTELIEKARTRGMRRIRLSAGGHEVLRRIYEKIDEEKQKVKKVDGYWLEL